MLTSKPIFVVSMFNRAIGLSAPLQPNLARWGTWLEASFFYAENFQIVKQIVSSFEDSGRLVERAKEAIADQDVFSELRQIISNYREIAVLSKKLPILQTRLLLLWKLFKISVLMTTHAK